MDDAYASAPSLLAGALAVRARPAGCVLLCTVCVGCGRAWVSGGALRERGSGNGTGKGVVFRDDDPGDLLAGTHIHTHKHSMMAMMMCARE